MESDSKLVFVAGILGRLIDSLPILADGFIEIAAVEVCVACALGCGRLNEGFVSGFQLLVGLNLVLCAVGIAEASQSFGEFKVDLRE